VSLVVADKDAVAAGVFTKNVMCAAPVTYCKDVLERKNTVRAVRGGGLDGCHSKWCSGTCWPAGCKMECCCGGWGVGHAEHSIACHCAPAELCMELCCDVQGGMRRKQGAG
jgi:hypothetical protein